jgi:hypothetical protein
MEKGGRGTREKREKRRERGLRGGKRGYISQFYDRVFVATPPKHDRIEEFRYVTAFSSPPVTIFPFASLFSPNFGNRAVGIPQTGTYHKDDQDNGQQPSPRQPQE